MNLLVNSFAPNDELKKATQQIADLVKQITPHKVSLSKEERKKIRTVGVSRLGLVEIVDRLSMHYDNKLAKEDNAIELNERVAYLHVLRTHKLAVKDLLEMLDDTDKAMGKDVMAYVDKFSDSLRSARKHDGDVDEAVKELDDYNARFGKIMEEDGENEKEDGNNETLKINNTKLQ